MGQDERYKGNQTTSQLGIWKNCKMEKITAYMLIPRAKARKTVIAEVCNLIGLFKCSIKMGASSNPHATCTSSTSTPETIIQIKK